VTIHEPAVAAGRFPEFGRQGLQALPASARPKANAPIIVPRPAAEAICASCASVPHFKSAMETMDCTVSTPVRADSAPSERFVQHPNVTTSIHLPP